MVKINHAWAIGLSDNAIVLFMYHDNASGRSWGCSSVGRATVLHAVGQRFARLDMDILLDDVGNTQVPQGL